MNRSVFAVAALCALFAFTTLAEPTLKVGDAAPPLAFDKWLKGEPVKALEPGKVYVIECWATWCGPCIASMPHVTKLQAKFKDKGVVVIGANVWERDPAASAPFVEKMGDKMGYAVATDDVSDGPQNGKMAMTWLKAAGRNGIPCSFLVDRKGKIAWIGHPMMMERPLALLADDQFDPAKEAEFTAKMDALQADFGAAMKAQEPDKAITALDQLAVMNPTMAAQYQSTKVSLLVKKKDYAGANALAAAVGEKADEANVLASLASALLSSPDAAGQTDAALALKLATRAYEQAKEGWQYEMTIARAHAAGKAYDKAAEWQQKAIDHAPAQLKPQLQTALDEYKTKAAEKK